MTKNLASVVLGVAAAPFIQHVEKYVFNDWDFLIYFLILIGLDTVLGVLKHIKHGTVSSAGWGIVGIKLTLYTCLLIMAHVITNFTIDGVNMQMFSWFDEAMYCVLMVKEGISIIENVGAIHSGLVPDWIRLRLKDFDEAGEYKKQEDPV